LRERLEQEIELKRLLRAIDVCTPDPKAIVHINKTIPCILHLEIRVGIKMFFMIASQGLSVQTDKKKQDDYVSNIEKVVNQNILGTYIQPCQWFFPMKVKEIDGEKNLLVLGEVGFTNPRVHVIVQSLELLIDVCIPNCDDQNSM
jgi:hypothetical protein